MTILNRDSFFSTSTSTTYPSTLSSLTPSSLGLTDSPSQLRRLPDAQKHASTPSPTRRVESPHGPRLDEKNQLRRSNLRPSQSIESITQETSQLRISQPTVTKRPSRLSMVSTAEQQSPSPRVQSTPVRTSQTTEQASLTGPRTQPTKLRAAATPTPSHESRAKTAPQADQAVAPSRAERRPAERDTRSVAIPQRREAHSLPPSEQVLSRARPAKVQTSTPAPAEDGMADEWEAELRGTATRLGEYGVGKQVTGYTKERVEQRRKDQEWERSGIWASQVDAAREAEEKTRREADRAIAYPPNMPRAPIRAAPSGPDETLPIPLFSPLGTYQEVELPGTESQGPKLKTVLHEAAQLEKAQAEYEAWLSRKQEREGGVGDDNDGIGSREWVPKNREQARPRIPQMPQVPQPSSLPVTPNDDGQTSMLGGDATQQWPYGYPGSYAYPWAGMPNMTEAQMYSMWDPSYYWWAMQNGQAMYEQEEADQQSQNKQTKVHFAGTPEELKHKSSSVSLAQSEQVKSVNGENGFAEV
ncbi:hypothetical protein M231_01662 [Tremella mesenterica]|uniref:Uncharacterized protein n=1 Tax=Tremella mesenterica TaxID=5217 RepID=A0A4Q1BSL8_TREME|nr:hypothetical protein M231_01662 [Tremella mesenterica]